MTSRALLFGTAFALALGSGAMAQPAKRRIEVRAPESAVMLLGINGMADGDENAHVRMRRARRVVMRR